MTEPNFNDGQTDPPDLSVRAAPSRVSGLRRRTIRLAIALLAAVVAAALIVGLGIDFRSHVPSAERRIDLPPDNPQPSPIADLPNSYAEVPRSQLPAGQPRTVPDDGHPHGDGMAMTGDADGQKAELARLLSSIQQIGRKNQELAGQIGAYQSAAQQEQAKVWASALFFKIDQTPDRQEHPAGARQSAGAAEALAALKNAAGTTPPGPPATAPPQPPTDQQRKLTFLNESPSPQTGIDRSSVPSASGGGTSDGYLLQAGTVIPAALLTGINTDLPGDVVASVTAPVYDSPTGDHLLIPQGARLYGVYDSQVSASQNRALLVWRRLLLPDGRSMNLERMRGTDAAGYAGLADQVDYHLDKLVTASLLSGVIAYAGNLAGGRQTLTLTPGNVVGDAVAQQAATTGSNIVQRQLNVQPTITIRPGWPVRVLVNRDIVLPAYSY